MAAHEKLLDSLHAADHARGHGEPLSEQFLRDLIDLIERYARVEKMVLGSIKVSYSSASLETDLKLPGNPIEQGECLARAERLRLALPPGPILELGYLIEDQGIKIIPRLFPENAGILGGFFFDAELGPSILLNVRTSPSEVDYTLARHYGHFLADYDPYITILSGRPQPETLGDPVQMRAHQFALAFLMPLEDLETYRDGMGLSAGGEVPVELVQQLSVYFNLDPEMVIWRLLSLGWLDVAELQRMLAQHADFNEKLRSAPLESSESPGQTLLPERFIRLVASAFGDDKLELDDAARFLGADLAETKRILGQFQFDSAKPKRGNGFSARRN